MLQMWQVTNIAHAVIHLWLEYFCQYFPLPLKSLFQQLIVAWLWAGVVKYLNIKYQMQKSSNSVHKMKTQKKLLNIKIQDSIKITL